MQGHSHTRFKRLTRHSNHTSKPRVGPKIYIHQTVKFTPSQEAENFINRLFLKYLHRASLLLFFELPLRLHSPAAEKNHYVCDYQNQICKWPVCMYKFSWCKIFSSPCTLYFGYVRKGSQSLYNLDTPVWNREYSAVIAATTFYS